MPQTNHIAVVSLTDDISTRDLLRVAAAIEKQVVRDFSPIWEIPATVNAFADLVSVPSDYHPVIIFGDADELAERLEAVIGEPAAASLLGYFARDQIAGIHLNAYTRQPFSLVAADDNWPVVTSHEILEMIADPQGSQLIAATHPTDPSSRVLYVLEVCDPCAAIWYPVNGIPVSDFYTPRYFDPVRSPSTRFSFTGEVTRPLEVLDGGYVSWIDPRDSCLYQWYGGDARPVLLDDVVALQQSSLPLRTLIDSDPRTRRAQTLREARNATGAAGVYAGVHEAATATALRTREAVLSMASRRG